MSQNVQQFGSVTLARARSAADLKRLLRDPLAGFFCSLAAYSTLKIILQSLMVLDLVFFNGFCHFE